jgi:C-terminal processing protease CtpA/Prc
LHDLDTVGLTLKNQGAAFVVVGIATKDGRPTVEGVEIGDNVIQIDGTKTKGATPGAIFAALHGRPGESRILTIERKGTEITTQVKVTAF